MTTNGMATNWTCYCGNFIEDSFVCDKCGLSAIGSDMKKHPDIDKMASGMLDDMKNMDWSVEKDEDLEIRKRNARKMIDELNEDMPDEEIFRRLNYWYATFNLGGK